MAANWVLVTQCPGVVYRAADEAQTQTTLWFFLTMGACILVFGAATAKLCMGDDSEANVLFEKLGSVGESVVSMGRPAKIAALICCGLFTTVILSVCISAAAG